ncbi:MAG TPA: YceI family protein [Gammaproteobacteria bacterium]|nr:YceI family protein [Gammaproteobacteria bacterium]
MTRLAVALLLVLSLPAFAATGPGKAGACWKLQPARSTLSFTGKQAGAPAHGHFRKYSAHFCFDPAQARGEIEAKVRLNSVDTSNSTRDGILRGPEFFDVSDYPVATYKASRFQALGDHRFRGHGTLTLHGHSRPVPVTFTFRQQGKRAHAQGEASLDRRAFDIGQGRWGSTRWVGARVHVRFDLALTRAGSARGAGH